MQRAYNIEHFVELDRITVHGKVSPRPYRYTNPVSVSCQLTQKHNQTPVLHLTLSDPDPALGFLADTMESRSVSRSPPLSHSGSRYMHPTHHIAVKSASDTSLLESAYAHLELCSASTACRCSVAPYVVHIYVGYYVCVRLPFCAVMGV